MIQYRGKFSKSSASLCNRHGRAKKGADADTSPEACAEGRTRLSDDLPRRSTLSARISRGCSRFHSRQFRGTDEGDESGIWRKKSIIIRPARYVRKATLLRVAAQKRW
jgi:hypothetical protein